MQSKDIQNFCKLDTAGEELVKMAITKIGLSARRFSTGVWIGICGNLGDEDVLGYNCSLHSVLHYSTHAST